MRLLLDQGLPRTTVAELASRSISADHVRDLGMSAATDTEILEAARAHDAVVVTLDADFHSLLAADRASSPSVVRIRMEGLKAPDIAILLQQALIAVAGDLDSGAAVSITRGGIRVRKLPLI